VLLADVTDTEARAAVAALTDSLLERYAEVLSGLVRGDEAAPEDLLDIAFERMARPTMGGDRPRALTTNDPAMERAAALIDRIARSTTHVLILGETGVGKDLIAQIIHDRADRASGPFVRVNCVAISPTPSSRKRRRTSWRGRGGGTVTSTRSAACRCAQLRPRLSARRSTERDARCPLRRQLNQDLMAT
jgi:hypothetical protein